MFSMLACHKCFFKLVRSIKVFHNLHIFAKPKPSYTKPRWLSLEILVQQLLLRDAAGTRFMLLDFQIIKYN